MTNTFNSYTKARKRSEMLICVFGLLIVLFIVRATLSKEDARASARTHELAQDTRTANGNTPRDPLEELFATHPHPGVSGEFYDLIENHQILLSHTASNDAEFMLVPREKMLIAGVVTDNALTPVLNLNPGFQARGERHVISQLVIYHEYVHYDQWRSGRTPEETFVLLPLKSSEPTRDMCTKKWYAEVDAYHKECVFARETGLIEQISADMTLGRICGATEETFDSVLRHTLEIADNGGEMCAQIWESL